MYSQPSDPQDEYIDMGFEFCESCKTTYIPAPGYKNDGHQCNEDGLQEEFKTDGQEDTV